MRSFITPAIVAMLAATSLVSAQAQTQTVSATGAATVRPAGPRTGVSGTNFFNVEGSSNNANASFGVLDFTPTANANATGISNLRLTLDESDAAFTAPGTFNIFLVTNTARSLTDTTLTFDAANTPGGFGSQLGTSYLLGTGTFTSPSTTTGTNNTGQIDIYDLTLPNTQATSLFLNDVKNGSTIRLALAATTATTAATFFGSTASAATTPGNAPVLSFNATSSSPVPEASTTASFGLLLALGLGGIAVARRRKQA